MFFPVSVNGRRLGILILGIINCGALPLSIVVLLLTVFVLLGALKLGPKLMPAPMLFSMSKFATWSNVPSPSPLLR